MDVKSARYTSRDRVDYPAARNKSVDRPGPRWPALSQREEGHGLTPTRDEDDSAEDTERDRLADAVADHEIALAGLRRDLAKLRDRLFLRFGRGEDGNGNGDGRRSDEEEGQKE